MFVMEVGIVHMDMMNLMPYYVAKIEHVLTFFRCRGSQICIHLGNVCDGFKDCIQGDNELLCEIHNMDCPSKCECLALAINCSHISIVPSNLSNFSPYLAVTVLYSRIHNLYNFITSLKNVQIVHFQDNNIINKCNFYDSFYPAKVIDNSYNIINNLEKNCFYNVMKL